MKKRERLEGNPDFHLFAVSEWAWEWVSEGGQGEYLVKMVLVEEKERERERERERVGALLIPSRARHSNQVSRCRVHFLSAALLPSFSNAVSMSVCQVAPLRFGSRDLVSPSVGWDWAGSGGEG